MKNLKQFKVILKAIKTGSIPFYDYSDGVFKLDSIGGERYSISVEDSIESIEAEIKAYQNDAKEYQKLIHANRHNLNWNWMNI